MDGALLVVGNGYTAPLDGVGRYRSFPALSVKRITKAFRAELRQQHGRSDVQVSCSATLSAGDWLGTCEIRQQPYTYRIHP